MNSKQFLRMAESIEPESCSKILAKMSLRAREVAQELVTKDLSSIPLAAAYNSTSERAHTSFWLLQAAALSINPSLTHTYTHDLKITISF